MIMWRRMSARKWRSVRNRYCRIWESYGIKYAKNIKNTYHFRLEVVIERYGYHNGNNQ